MKPKNECPICSQNLDYDYKDQFYYCPQCGFNHNPSEKQFKLKESGTKD